MSDYSAPLDDMRFVLENIVDLPALATLPGFEHAEPEMVYGVLEESGRFFSQEFAPLNQVGDTQHSRRNPDGSVSTPDGFPRAYQRYVDAGWAGVPFPAEYGGGGFPWLVAIAMQEMLTAANMGFSLCPLLTQGAIDMLLHYGSEEQREVYLPKMVSGEWTGTMNLTEPQAGSDVGALTTKAVPGDDGSWRITGQKIFITYGEHDLADNIIHLVLARVPDAPAGTKGISCFIVPKFLLNDDGTPGMRYMFKMMNNARVSVGVSGLSLGERAYQQAVAYAEERRQGRAPGAPAGASSPIVDHPDVRRMLLTMRAHIEALRCLAYLNAECLDIAARHRDEDTRTRGQERADLLTPITKGWGTDVGVELTSLAVQVHGGMGYIEETGVAQHYRDIRIAPIYEGTNGIQAMDMVGRKLPMRAGGVMADHLAAIDATAAEAGAADGDLREIGKRLADAHATLKSTTDWLLANGLADPNNALAGATPYLRMCGIVTGGWLLARSAQAAQRQLAAGVGDAEFLRQKGVTARVYPEQLLPQGP